MKKLAVLMLLLALCVPSVAEARKNKPIPYTVSNPHMYVKNGYVNIEWHSDVKANYVIFKYIGTATPPLGIQYKLIPVWHRTLPAGNIRIRFKGTQIIYELHRVR